MGQNDVVPPKQMLTVLQPWSMGEDSADLLSPAVFLLPTNGGRDVATVSSHSCEAILLSWDSKAALPVLNRRLLGGHAKPGESTSLESSRDALAGPLYRLGHGR